MSQEPRTCDGCEYPAKRLRSYPAPHLQPERQEFLFCDICSNTLVGNSAQYPGQYDDRNVLKTLAYIGNMMLDAVREKQT